MLKAIIKHRSALITLLLVLVSSGTFAVADPPVVDATVFPLGLYSSEGRSEDAFLVAFADGSLFETGFQTQWTLDKNDPMSWQDAGDPIPPRNPPQYAAAGTRPSKVYSVLPKVCAPTDPSPPVPSSDPVYFRTRAMFTHGLSQIPPDLDLINGPWYVDPAIPGPCAPRSVTGSLSGSTPMLTWVNVHDFPTDPIKTGIAIYRSPNPFTLGSGNPLTTLGPNATSFLDTYSPPPASRLYYAVVAIRQKTVDAAIETSKSVGIPTPVAIDTPGAPTPTPTATSSVFDPPSNLTAVLQGTNQAKLDWVDNSTLEAGFFVDFGADSCACDGRIVLASPNTTTYTQSGLPLDATRFYRVRAYRTDVPEPDNITAPSNLASVDTPPLAPTNLRTDAVTNAFVDLRWNDNSATEDGFRVEYCNGTCGDTMTWLSSPGTWTVGANQVTFRDGTVTGGITRSYRVFATKGALSSPRSNIITRTTPPTPLIPPSNLLASQVPNDGHKLSLTWQNNDANTQSYRIEYASVPVGPWGTLVAGCTTPNQTICPSTMSYLDTFALNAGQQRCYRVRAFHSAIGASDPSNISCAQTFGPQVPIDPTNLSGVALDHARIRLTWTDNATNEDGFKIYRSTDGGQSYILWKTLVNTDPALVVCSPSLTCRRHIVTGLYPATPYTFKVTAFNQDGESGPSNAITVPTLGPPMPSWVNPSPANQTPGGEPTNTSVYTCEISGKAAASAGVDSVAVDVYDTVAAKFIEDPDLDAIPVNPTTGEWSLSYLQFEFKPGRYNLAARAHIVVSGSDVYSQPAFINGWLIPADHAPCPITNPTPSPSP